MAWGDSVGENNQRILLVFFLLGRFCLAQETREALFVEKTIANLIGNDTTAWKEVFSKWGTLTPQKRLQTLGEIRISNQQKVRDGGDPRAVAKELGLKDLRGLSSDATIDTSTIPEEVRTRLGLSAEVSVQDLLQKLSAQEPSAFPRHVWAELVGGIRQLRIDRDDLNFLLSELGTHFERMRRVWPQRRIRTIPSPRGAVLKPPRRFQRAPQGARARSVNTPTARRALQDMMAQGNKSVMFTSFYPEMGPRLCQGTPVGVENAQSFCQVAMVTAAHCVIFARDKVMQEMRVDDLSFASLKNVSTDGRTDIALVTFTTDPSACSRLKPVAIARPGIGLVKIDTQTGGTLGGFATRLSPERLWGRMEIPAQTGIQRGDSGGGVYNARGEWIGTVSSMEKGTRGRTSYFASNYSWLRRELSNWAYEVRNAVPHITLNHTRPASEAGHL